VIDYRDWQLPLGRRFRSIKLWFVLRHYGLDGIRAALREHVALGAWLAGEVEEVPELELIAPPRLGLVCFRHVDGDDATEALLNRLNAEPSVHLTHTRLAGRYAIRVSIGQTGTRREHVERLWELISSASRRP
jgi:aromatic-L-amino-acid decarboxylase